MATGVPIWTDLHDYDGRSTFHAPFADAAAFVFMNGDRTSSVRELLRACVWRGAQVAVAHALADGRWPCTPGATSTTSPPNRMARIVDTNGAGDGFMAGEIAAHLDGADGRVARVRRAAGRRGAPATYQPCPR